MDNPLSSSPLKTIPFESFSDTLKTRVKSKFNEVALFLNVINLSLTGFLSLRSKEISFNALQEKLGFTSGNLSIQMDNRSQSNNETSDSLNKESS